MYKPTKEELAVILEEHNKWCLDKRSGEIADLRNADLCNVDLCEVNLRHANFQGANLKGAILEGANLEGANFREANLQGANLRGADLRGAVLVDANIQGANLDFSAWPLNCGLCNVKADDRLVSQLIYHITRFNISGCSGGVKEVVDHLRNMAISDLFCEYRSDLKTIEELLNGDAPLRVMQC